MWWVSVISKSVFDVGVNVDQVIVSLSNSVECNYYDRTTMQEAEKDWPEKFLAIFFNIQARLNFTFKFYLQ